VKPSGVDGPPAATPRTPRTLRRQEVGISLLVPRPHYALFHNRENRQHHRPATLTLGRTRPYRGGVSTMTHASAALSPPGGLPCPGGASRLVCQRRPSLLRGEMPAPGPPSRPGCLSILIRCAPYVAQHLPLLSLKHPRQQGPPKLCPSPSTIFYLREETSSLIWAFISRMAPLM
jgi:hypothetical protein